VAGPISEELSALIERAGWLGQGDDAPVASFTSLFLAMLTMRDPWSRWAQATARRTGVTRERVLAHWEATTRHQRWQRARGRLRRRGSVALSAVRFTQTSNALIERLPETGAHVRHLIGAYIFAHGREDDLRAWGFHRERWSALFLGRLGRLHPGEVSQYRESVLRSSALASPKRWAGRVR